MEKKGKNIKKKQWNRKERKKERRKKEERKKEEKSDLSPRARKWIEIEKGLRQKWTGGTKLGPIVSEKKWKSKSDNAPFSRKIASKSGSLNKKILKVPEIKN